SKNKNCSNYKKEVEVLLKSQVEHISVGHAKKLLVKKKSYSQATTSGKQSNPPSKDMPHTTLSNSRKYQHQSDNVKSSTSKADVTLSQASSLPDLAHSAGKRDALQSKVKTAQSPLPQRPGRSSRTSGRRKSKTLSAKDLEVISVSQTLLSQSRDDAPHLLECSSSIESSPQVVVHCSKEVNNIQPKRPRSSSPSSPVNDQAKKKNLATTSSMSNQKKEGVKPKPHLVSSKTNSSAQSVPIKNRFDVLSRDVETSEGGLKPPSLEKSNAAASKKPSLSRSLSSARNFLMEAKNTFKI
ncbi:MAG: hypothetical protein AAGM46_27370, partial [Cyanobacteria bacterium J06582_2]